MKLRLSFLLSTIMLSVLMSDAVVWAHPGHGHAGSISESQGAWHYVTEPMHFLPLLAVIAVSVAVIVKLRRHPISRPATAN